jgi:hypothetical protein
MTRSQGWVRPRLAAPCRGQHLCLGAASAILCAVCLAAVACPAQAVTRPTVPLSFVDIVRDGVDGVHGLYGPRAVAVLARDAATGKLRRVETHRDGSGSIDDLAGAFDAVMSPDGAVSVDEIVSAVGRALDGCPATLVAGDHARSLVIDGKTRLYDLHVPPGYHGTAPVPLVLDFHGFGKNKTWQAGLSGFKERADSEGFIVAYPLGSFGATNDPEAPTTVGPAWDGGACCTVIPVDDVGFARAVVQAVAAEADIERRRVYATGTSNGGALLHRLACEA